MIWNFSYMIYVCGMIWYDMTHGYSAIRGTKQIVDICDIISLYMERNVSSSRCSWADALILPIALRDSFVELPLDGIGVPL